MAFEKFVAQRKIQKERRYMKKVLIGIGVGLLLVFLGQIVLGLVYSKDLETHHFADAKDLAVFGCILSEFKANPELNYPIVGFAMLEKLGERPRWSFIRKNARNQKFEAAFCDVKGIYLSSGEKVQITYPFYLERISPLIFFDDFKGTPSRQPVFES